MLLCSIDFIKMQLFVQRPDGSLTPYSYGTPLAPGEVILPIGPQWSQQPRGNWRGRGRGNWNQWRQPRDPSRGRQPTQQSARQRSRSRSQSRRRRLNRQEEVGGPYNGQIPCAEDGAHTGAANNRHPHNHPDDRVKGTRPGDYVIPSRARFTGISHKDLGAGITSHRYCFEYSTRSVNNIELQRRVRLVGQVADITQQVEQVEI